MMIRGWDRLVHPNIWAEDGTVFLSGALHGVPLLAPSDGYIQFFQRSLVTVAAVFPFSHLPAILCAACYCIVAYILSMPADRSFSWLIPSGAMRIALTIALSLAPGLYEMAGNVANLYTFFLFGLGMIGLRSLESRPSWRDCGFGVAVASSAGAAILFAPLFLCRLFLRFRKEKSLLRLLPEGSIVGAMALFTTLNFFAAQKVPLNTAPEIPAIASNYLAIITGLHLFAPVGGAAAATFLFQSAKWLLSLLALAITFAVALSLKKTKASAIALLLLFEAGILALPLLTFIVRPGAIAHFSPEYMADPAFWRIRYAFGPFAAGSVLLFAAIARLRPWLQYAVALVLIAVHATSQPFLFLRYGEREWGPLAKALEHAYENEEQIRIPIYPEPWVMEFHPSDDR